RHPILADGHAQSHLPAHLPLLHRAGTLRRRADRGCGRDWDQLMLTLTPIVTVILLLLGFPMMLPLLAASLMLLLLVLQMANGGLSIGEVVGGGQRWPRAAVRVASLAAETVTGGHTADRLLGRVQGFGGHLRGALPLTTAARCRWLGAVRFPTPGRVVPMHG